MIGNKTIKTVFLTAILLLTSLITFSQDKSASEDPAKINERERLEEFDINDMIMHHIKDAHRFHFWGGEEDGAILYLPVIIVDNGIHFFSSKQLYEGVADSTLDESTGEYIHYKKGAGNYGDYALFHEKIYKTDGGQLHFEHGHPTNAMPLSLSMTKNVFILLLVSSILLFFAFKTARHYKKNGAVAPKGVAKFIEPLIIFVRDDIAKDIIGEKHYKRFTPYLLTLFLFLLISNLCGLLPILGANLSGSITITLFFAVVTLLYTLFSSNGNYWNHIFNTPGVPKPLLLIMIPIEFIGIFTKPFALTIRLFANMTAGHVIILAFVGLIFINKNMAWGALSVPMSVFISVLEILVAFIQAYLFALLSALYIAGAVEEAHHD